jgi:Tol biopolymer transport system component
MSKLTHAQARQYLDARTDGVISPVQQQALDAHLAHCAHCMEYVRWLHGYEAWLESSLQEAGPTRRTSSPQELQRVRLSVSEKVNQMKRMRPFVVAAGSLAAVGTLIVVGIILAMLLRTRNPQPADDPTATPGGTQDAQFTPAPGDPNAIPAGLVIVTMNNSSGTRSLWIQNHNGTLEPLLENVYASGFALSQDGTKVLYASEGDLWQFDLETRQSQNLTQTPDTAEWHPVWTSLGYLYLAAPNDQAGGAIPAGTLMSSMPGASPAVLITDPIAPLVIAPSPDGLSVAYITFNGGYELWLVTQTGAELIDLTGYEGQPQARSVRWSADGQQLMLAAAIQGAGSTSGAIATLDIATREYRMLFTYDAIQTDWSLQGTAPVWSPDAAWMIFPVQSADPLIAGLSVIETAAIDQVRHIALAGLPPFANDAVSNPERKSMLTNPVISPNGQWAAVAVYPADLLVVRRSDWMPIALGLPGNAEDFAISEVLGWGVLPATTPEFDLPTPTPLPTPDSAAIVPPADIPPGLIISLPHDTLDGQILMVGASGEMISGGFYATGTTSPDGTMTILPLDNDIYLGEQERPNGQNLTNTPDRVEQYPMWLPGNTEGFLCLSYPNGELPAMALGYLTYVGFDGTYQVLLPDAPLYTLPAPSPDGQTLAISGRGDVAGLWLYTLDSGEWQEIVLPTLPQPQGEPMPQGQPTASEVSWSPFGRQLTLTMTGIFDEDGVSVIGIGLYDLDTGELRVLHTYRPMGMDGSVSGVPQWSPDSMWLIFDTMLAEDPAERGLWLVLPSSGMGRIADGPGAISPDGKWVASNRDGDVVLFPSNAWGSPVVWEMPGNARVLKWINYVGP